MHPVKQYFFLREPQWRTDDRPKQTATVVLDRPIIAADLSDPKAERERYRAHLRKRFGLEPPAPSDWSWGERMVGRKHRTLSFRERLAGGRS